MAPWIAENGLARLTASLAARSWLNERGSLTLRLRSEHPGLAVRVLAEGIDHLLPDEALRLGLVGARPAWVREVTLHADGLALVEARTAIPDWSQANPWFEVQRLGNRALGEILFADTGLDRSGFEFTLDAGWRDRSPEPRLARRCLYRRQGAPLLLSERFLQLAA